MRLLPKRWSSTTAASGRRRCFRLQVEPLEGRALLSLTPIDFAATITSQPVVMNGTLYFSASDASHGDELWKSDGTRSGTVLVSDISAGTLGSHPRNLTVVGNTVFFTANDGTHGIELWKSDGTASGTALVDDIYPGSGGSSSANLMNVNGMLCFTAYTTTYGTELWQSDGTSGGTTQVADIDPGAMSSNPTNFVVGGSTLFLTATDASNPTRLWMGTFTVGPSLPQVSVGSTLPNSTYGQAVSFTVTVSGGGPTPTGTVQFLVDGTAFGSAVTLAGGSATSPSTTLLGAGNHTIEADYSGDSNYSATSGIFIQGVSKAYLTVTADPKSKVYGAALPPLTATLSGFVNGENPSVVSGAPTLTTAATAASDVTGSSYPILASAGSLWTANYSFVFVSGTLSITPASLTITANNAGMMQGTEVPPLSVSYSGFVNGDSPASLTTQPMVTTPASPFSPAGAYSIVAGGASAPNYAISYASGVLIVTPAPVRVLSVSIQAVRLGKSKKTTQVIVLQFSGSLNAGGSEHRQLQSCNDPQQQEAEEQGGRTVPGDLQPCQ